MGWMPLMKTGLAIRMDILNEQQANRNHGQTLARLAERGGLSPDEALAIVERRDWRRGPGAVDAVVCLAALQQNEHLQKLGARLSELLDEDQWAECEALLRAAGVTPNDQGKRT